MALDDSVEAWEALFGQAQGQVEPSSNFGSSGIVQGEFRPFLFSLAAKDAYHLRLCVSDFHSQTWQEDFSVRQLDDLREDVGIGEKLDDFLAYLRSALSSENVRFVGGATSATIVAQKIKGTPFVSLPLKKLGGSAADDVKGSIAFGNFGAFLALSSSIMAEKAQVGALKAALAAEKGQTEKLQEQIDASSLGCKSRKKLNRIYSPLSTSASQQPDLPSTQHNTQAVLPSPPAISSGTFQGGNEGAVPKAPGSSSRVRGVPPSRRVKQRGTIIRESRDA